MQKLSFNEQVRNPLGVKHRSILMFEKYCRSVSHWIHSVLTSSGISSSHPSLQSFWRNFFAVSTTGARNPIGSCNELVTDSNPLLVVGFLFIAAPNVNASFSTSHNTPRALSTGKVSFSKSRSITDFALSLLGMVYITSLLLLIHFVKWNPPIVWASLSTVWSAQLHSFLSRQT